MIVLDTKYQLVFFDRIHNIFINEDDELEISGTSMNYTFEIRLDYNQDFDHIKQCIVDGNENPSKTTIIDVYIEKGKNG